MRAKTLFHRQIHPSCFRNGRVESPAFRPTESHKWKLSTDDGDRISPEAAWERYTTVRKLLSIGTMAVTREECDEQRLPIIEDGGTDPDLASEHVSIDFNGLDRKTMEKLSKKLRDAALARDWTYRPE